jgi:DNA-binding NarL/FixJ family response regulator
LQRATTSPENAVRHMRLANSLDVSESARHVQCPTLVIHANRDRVVPIEEGRICAGLIPNSRFVQLESENHLLLEDEPAWARMMEALNAFLPADQDARRQGPFALLSKRETDVLELIARGKDNAQIAACLDLSGKTVRNYITCVFAKLEVENRSQAIVLAREAGFGGK